MRVPDYVLGEWCDTCDAPQWITPDEQHHCEEVWQDYLDAIKNGEGHPLRKKVNES